MCDMLFTANSHDGLDRERDSLVDPRPWGGGGCGAGDMSGIETPPVNSDFDSNSDNESFSGVFNDKPISEHMMEYIREMEEMTRILREEFKIEY